MPALPAGTASARVGIRSTFDDDPSGKSRRIAVDLRANQPIATGANGRA